MAKCRCDYCMGGINRRQEIRHGGVTEEELPWRKPGGKRSQQKKKWCRGKEGREHNFMRMKVWAWSNTEAEVCTLCGKRGRYFWNFKY